MKRCSKCGVQKPCEHFSKDIRHKDGLHSACIKCERKPRSEWNEQTKNKVREWEKRQRAALTDLMVKKAILIGSKGSIKTQQITDEMIVTKRKSILTHRQRAEEIKTNPKESGPFKVKCLVCGIEFIHQNPLVKVCPSIKCHKEKAKRNSFNNSKGKKVLKARACKECGIMFIPEYGNKKRLFCSTRCLDRYQNRTKCRNGRERARKYGCDYEYVNPLKVFIRDGWRCQLCQRKLKSKDRGSFKDSAPELDHIIPLSKGGAHSYKNTQCICRKCNSEKGVDEVGQLRLFG